MYIPFNKPYITGKEFACMSKAIENGHLSGNGEFSKKCEAWLENKTCSIKALLTHSCTASLEMSAMLADFSPGDQVIMPSYTFVSTANAFVMKGAVPVFVDIRSDTMNIDETKIEEAITDKTRAIVIVHYGGVSCEMDTILSITGKYNLMLIEDNAQGIMCSYKDRPLGSFASMATLSFHETKNIHSGEGGALLINEKNLIERAEIIREKGTDRSKFFRGQIDKYTWVDKGSSYLPGELVAGFLYAQMEECENITEKRLNIWHKYHSELHDLEQKEKLRRPIVPSICKHNGHIYYILLPDFKKRSHFIFEMNKKGINTVFHYVPLHNSPAGKKYGLTTGNLPVTESISERLVRLPLWIGIEEKLDYIIEQIKLYFL